MMEAMGLAICRAAEQPLPTAHFSHELPDWAHRIADELTCTVFKGIVNFAPRGKKYEARKGGQIFGLHIRAALFYWKEITPILEREGLTNLTSEQKKKLEKMSG